MLKDALVPTPFTVEAEPPPATVERVQGGVRVRRTLFPASTM